MRAERRKGNTEVKTHVMQWHPHINLPGDKHRLLKGGSTMLKTQSFFYLAHKASDALPPGNDGSGGDGGGGGK